VQSSYESRLLHGFINTLSDDTESHCQYCCIFLHKQCKGSMNKHQCHFAFSTTDVYTMATLLTINKFVDLFIFLSCQRKSKIRDTSFIQLLSTKQLAKMLFSVRWFLGSSHLHSAVAYVMQCSLVWLVLVYILVLHMLCNVHQFGQFSFEVCCGKY